MFREVGIVPLVIYMFLVRPCPCSTASLSLSSVLLSCVLSITSRGIGISVSRTVLLSLVIETLSFFRDRYVICRWISIS